MSSIAIKVSYYRITPSLFQIVYMLVEIVPKYHYMALVHNLLVECDHLLWGEKIAV